MEELEWVDGSTLVPIVREATSRGRLQLESWTVQSIQGGAGRGEGLHRVSGEATDGDERLSWSVILKTIAAETESESPDSWSYWRREADAYESGFLDELPGSLYAPRLLASQELGSGLVGIWLEDLHQAVDGWSMSDFGEAAASLGEFNGAFVEARPFPDSPWLSRDWLRRYVECNAPMIDLLRKSADDPWVSRAFPPQVLEAKLDVWEQREWCFDVLARLPQTLCHLDAFDRNLFRAPGVDGETATFAIDWAFVGSGAVGEELGPLVLAGVIFGAIEIEAFAELERRAVEGYMTGLSRSGFECDERLVRLAFCASAGLRYSIGPMESFLPALLDEEVHPLFEPLFGVSVDAVCDRARSVEGEVLGPLIHEARALERQLDLL